MVDSRGRSKRLSLTPEFEKKFEPSQGHNYRSLGRKGVFFGLFCMLSTLFYRYQCSNLALVVKYKSRFQQCPGLGPPHSETCGNSMAQP